MPNYFSPRISGAAAAAAGANNNEMDDGDDLGQAGAAALSLGHDRLPRIGSDLPSAAKKKRFYDFPLFGKLRFKVGFDRLALLALLDRSVSLVEASASVFLAIGVAVMTGLVLNQNHYQGELISAELLRRAVMLSNHPLIFILAAGINV